MAHSTRPDDVQRSLIKETAELGPISGMQIAPDQGVLLGVLVRLCRAQFIVEVGTFTGYSSLAMAKALPEGGRILCCDVSEEWTAIARRHWERAGVADRIELRIAPAIETLKSLPNGPVVDMAFIDADKGGYQSYYDELIVRMKAGGLICIDNTLWSGRVAASDTDVDADTAALKAFNDNLVDDDRVDVVLLTVGDGLTIAQKR
jgi:caffeoyl-CoA O-methyltransferase